MEQIGIDVHKNESQICLLTDQGEVLEKRIATRRERFAAVLDGRPRARILIEASTESEWVARCLEELGHEVIVADPNFAPMYATRSRRVKTDRRDAQALMDACRLGAYRPIHRTSEAQRQVRALLIARDTLVRARVRQIQVLRALLRREGLRVRSGQAASFGERMDAVEMPEWLVAIVAPVRVPPWRKAIDSW
jgi:transposase